MRPNLTIATFVVVSVAAALGIVPLLAAQERAASLDDCQLRVTTGKKGKGFSRMLRDIQSLCGVQVLLCEVESEGGLQNTVALSANEADLGFVQIDTLQTMKQSDENIAALQAVLPLNANLLHVLARRDGYTMRSERSLATLFRREEKTVLIRKISDLKGLPVAVVASAQLLGRTLDRSFGYGWRFVDVDSDDQAIAALKAGEVAAVFCLGGWPNATIDGLGRDSAITLVAYDLPMQAPYQLVRKNYAKLGVFNLPFLAAPNLLVTRPFKLDGSRGRYVSALQRCILSNLDTLREGAFEPAWKEIKSSTETYGWPRFGAEHEATLNRPSELELHVRTVSPAGRRAE